MAAGGRIQVPFSISAEAENTALQHRLTRLVFVAQAAVDLGTGFVLIFLCKERKPQGRVPQLSSYSPDGSPTNALIPAL